MSKTICSECGQPEGSCYAICPTQDPYAGNQEAEEADYSFNARYDRFDGWDRGDLDNHEQWAAEVGVECLGHNFITVAIHIANMKPLAVHVTDDSIPF